MMAWPTDDDMLIRHYVRTCPIRTRSTQVVARSTLWRFQQFVRTSRPNEPLSQGHSVFEFNTDESQCLCRLGSQPAASRRYVGFARPP